MNICRDCKHLIGGNGGIWTYLCGKAERIPIIDPVTGESGFAAKNDLGGSYVTSDQYENCKTINTTGECKMFENVPSEKEVTDEIEGKSYSVGGEVQESGSTQALLPDGGKRE